MSSIFNEKINNWLFVLKESSHNETIFKSSLARVDPLLQKQFHLTKVADIRSCLLVMWLFICTVIVVTNVVNSDGEHRYSITCCHSTLCIVMSLIQLQRHWCERWSCWIIWQRLTTMESWQSLVQWWLSFHWTLSLPRWWLQAATTTAPMRSCPLCPCCLVSRAVCVC